MTSASVAGVRARVCLMGLPAMVGAISHMGLWRT